MASSEVQNAGPGPASRAPDTAPGPHHRCEVCSTGHLRTEHVRTALWLGDRLVVIEGVPALVCSNCGEQFFHDETAMRLDMMRGQGFPRERAAREITVPVFAFEGAEDRDTGDDT